MVSHKVIIKNGIGIVDATLTDAPCCPKGKTEYEIAEDRKEDQRNAEDYEKEEVQMKWVKKQQPGVDTEARYLRKGKEVHFGYKKVILTDENGMQLSVHTTTANEHDSKGLKPCLENQDEEIAISACLTDKGFQVPDNVTLFKSPIKNRKVKNRIMHKAYKNRPLTEWQKKYNRLISKKRWVTIGEKVTEIGNYLFKDCKRLSEVTIPKSVKKIGFQTFQNCLQLDTLTIIGNTLKTIDEAAFLGCSKLKFLTIPESVEKIGDKAFNNCTDLINVTIVDGDYPLIFEGNNYQNPCFRGCEIKTIYLGRDLDYYTCGCAPFREITSLSSLTIGKKVKKIGDCLFWGCTKLSEIHVQNLVPPQLGTNCFYGVPKAKSPCKLYIPECSAANAYSTNWEWALPNIYAEGANTSCDSYLTISPETWNFPAIGGEKTITVNSNQSWFVSNYPLWLKIPTTNGENNGTFTIEAFANPTTTSRSTTINVSGGGITRTINVTQDGVVAICEVESDKLQIFPNPAQVEISIQSEFLIEKVEIYSITGTLLRIENNFKVKISVSDLAQGIYFLKLHTDKGVVNSKFVKE